MMRVSLSSSLMVLGALLGHLVVLLHVAEAFDSTVLISKTQYKFLMSVGREPGTAMPPEWASSGARLAMPLDVQFLDDTVNSNDDNNNNNNNMERLLGPNRAKIMKPMNSPTFVSQRGTENVQVSSQGGWSTAANGVKIDLRFFLDFPNGAKRNDIVLPAERIYFATSCWLTADERLQQAKNQLKMTEETFDKLKTELETMVDQQEKKNPLEKATAMRPLVLMTEEKQRVQKRLGLQRSALPKEDAVSCPNGVLMAKDGLMYVKRFGGLLRNREEYHIVGRFTCVEADLML